MGYKEASTLASSGYSVEKVTLPLSAGLGISEVQERGYQMWQKGSAKTKRLKLVQCLQKIDNGVRNSNKLK